MDQSELLTTLVVRGASLLLVVLLVRLAAALALAALARLILDPRRARRLADCAVRVAPGFARGALVVVTGAGVAVTTTGVVQAAPVPTPVVAGAPHVPVLDRATTAATGVAAPTSRPHLPPRNFPPAHPPRPATHVVRGGESLWTIAADALGPRASTRSVAVSWPRWYSANRRTIGSDPSHLAPGQVLRVPTTERAR